MSDTAIEWIDSESLIELARRIATEAHAGQKRHGGEPYITHPKAVAALVEEHLRPAAWLHDVVEDTNVGLTDLLNAGIPRVVVDTVAVLTHRPGEKYLDYILRVRNDTSATVIKLADLAHNLSTLEPRNKTMRDKYELARFILAQSLGKIGPELHQLVVL
jgi:(p)ppGpp synthase/HD superfamily hydrolase